MTVSRPRVCVRVITARESNTYDLVDNAALVLTKPALEYLEGVLA